jgi:ABC-2 type transport system permease protein
MRGAWIIAGKDLRNIFLSPLFYVIAGICCLAWTILFIVAVAGFLQPQMMMMSGEGMNLHFTVFAKHISLVNLVMIFAVAAISMRLFPEEKRQRTFDLLLTSPVTATDITVGKLIAGTLTAWALVAVSFLYPLSLAIWGQLDWGPLACSYIGLMLLVAVYVAIDMFTSSLTESTVLAVIMALIANVLLWFFGAAAESADGPVQKAIFDHLNVSTHYVNFLKGNFSISGVVYFASVVFFFSFLTQRVVESTRWR